MAHCDYRCGSGGVPLLFVHANGYTPRAYQQLLQGLSSRFEVSAPALRPLWPEAEPTREWGVLARDLAGWIDRTYRGPVSAAGHSLGAVVLLLAAAQRPARFRSLVLIEPVTLPAWATWLLRHAPARIRERGPLAMAARNRPSAWPSREAAFAFERRRRAHARIGDSVLGDILADGLVDAPGGGVKRRYSPEWEARLFESPPDVRAALRARLPPVTVVRGASSSLFTERHLSRWRRLRPHDRVVEVTGAGHLAPLERPEELSEIIEAESPPNQLASTPDSDMRRPTT